MEDSMPAIHPSAEWPVGQQPSGWIAAITPHAEWPEGQQRYGIKTSVYPSDGGKLLRYEKYTSTDLGSLTTLQVKTAAPAE